MGFTKWQLNAKLSYNNKSTEEQRLSDRITDVCHFVKPHSVGRNRHSYRAIRKQTTLKLNSKLMSFFSSLFASEDKHSKIQKLQVQIEQYRRNIENERMNMARYRASNAPRHYQDSGKARIAQLRSQIAQCRIEISRLRTR